MQNLIRKAIVGTILAVGVVGMVGGAAFADTPSSAPHGAQNSSDYSLTTTVENDTPFPLTLMPDSAKIDNGAHWVTDPLPTTIAPNGGKETYEAANHGNGIQMWLNFQIPSGEYITVNPDVPKVNVNTANWTAYSASGQWMNSHLKNYTTGRSIGWGDTPTATYKVDYCSPDVCPVG